MSHQPHRDVLTSLTRGCALLGVCAASLAVGATVAKSSSETGVSSPVSAGSVGATGCSQLKKTASLFPSAERVGFTERDAVKREPARGDIWPGWCGKKLWWTSYRTRKAYVDVSIALYATRHDVERALHEPAYPAYGPVQMLGNGSRVRTSGPTAGSVEGVPSSDTGVVSTYRNLFVSSISISTAQTPIPVAAQLRIHRAIEMAFRSLR